MTGQKIPFSTWQRDVLNQANNASNALFRLENVPFDYAKRYQRGEIVLQAAAALVQAALEMASRFATDLLGAVAALPTPTASTRSRAVAAKALPAPTKRGNATGKATRRA